MLELLRNYAWLPDAESAVGPWRHFLPLVNRLAARDLRAEFANLKRLLEGVES